MLFKIKSLDFGAAGVIFHACKSSLCKSNTNDICLSVAWCLCYKHSHIHVLPLANTQMG